MDSRDLDKYETLRRLALAGSRGDDLQGTAETALRQAAGLVRLQAAAMYLWDEKMAITVAVTHAESDAAREKLVSLEEELFRGLRRDRQMLSAYMTFGGETPMHSFTLPLRHGTKVFGTVIGIQEGDRKLLAEDAFLEALSAAIALNVLAEGIGQEKVISKDARQKERLGAIIETAVTVNHEINNPLTAILGNVQLLLLKRKDLDKDLSDKLKTIEASAMKIRDVTQRLLRLTSARSVEYTEGTSMLDLSDEPKDENKP